MIKRPESEAAYPAYLRRIGEHRIAEYLEDLQAEVETHERMFLDYQKCIRERDALLQVLKEIDVFGECRQCRHRKDDSASECDDAGYDCKGCKADCICRSCVNGGEWEWKGVK